VIRVLVAAAFPTVRAGLAAVLRAEPGIEVVGEAAGAEQLIALAASLQPHAVLAELESADDEMIEAVWQIAGAGQAPGTVIVCDATERWALEALRAGVRGVLARDSSGGELAAAVLAAANGLVVLDATAIRPLLPSQSMPVSETVTQGLGEALTPRELEVLRLLSEGLGNKMISRRLGISEHTVKFHVGAIMAKLNAGSRTEAVTVAARRGLIWL
jgi:DNA-binding NarL/FixJ family response regulator